MSKLAVCFIQMAGERIESCLPLDIAIAGSTTATVLQNVTEMTKISVKKFTDWGKKIGENMQFCKMKHSLGKFVQLIFNFCVLLLTFFSLFKGFAPSKRTYILQLCTANIMSILMIQACTQMASKANGGKSKGGCLREEDITLHNTSTYTCGLKIKRLRRRIHFGH